MAIDQQRQLLLPGLFLNINGNQHYVWSPELRAQLKEAVADDRPAGLGAEIRNGGVLYLLPPGSQERFSTFLPVLRRGNQQGEYLLGESKTIFLDDWDDQTAVERAIDWMRQRRKEEIDDWLDCIRPGYVPVEHQLVILDGGFLYKNRDVRYYLPPPVFRRFLARMNRAITHKQD